MALHPLTREVARGGRSIELTALEFDLLQTWVTWGETGQAGLWEFSRVMETVASEPQLGRVLEHSLFDVGSVDGGVLLEMLRGAREYGQGRIEQALARFERAAAVATNPLLCMCIANTYRALGRNREALATLEAGMARWPQDDSLRPPAVGIAFALGQAVGAYGLSFLFARGEVGYAVLFAIGGGALALALAIDLGAARAERIIPR